MYNSLIGVSVSVAGTSAWPQPLLGLHQPKTCPRGALRILKLNLPVQEGKKKGISSTPTAPLSKAGSLVWGADKQILGKLF